MDIPIDSSVQPLPALVQPQTDNSSTGTVFNRDVEICTSPAEMRRPPEPEALPKIVSPTPTEQKPSLAEIFKIDELRSNVVKYMGLSEVISLDKLINGSRTFRLGTDLSGKKHLYDYDLIEDWISHRRAQPIDSEIWSNCGPLKYYDVYEPTIRGIPLEGLEAYSTVGWDEVDFSWDAKLISYREGENETDDWHLFGEVEGLGVFHFAAGCNNSGFESQGSGVITVAPNWKSLIDNLDGNEFEIFVENLNDNV